MMVATLMRRRHYEPAPETLTRLVKLLAASVVLGVLLAAASALRPYYEHQIFHRKEISVVVVSCLALALYAALLLAFRAVTPAEIRAALKRSPKAKGGDLAEPDLP